MDAIEGVRSSAFDWADHYLAALHSARVTGERERGTDTIEWDQLMV